MYHAIILEDILDCLNVMHAFGAGDDELARALRDRATAMARFLGDVVHADGELPFFNDTAIGIAPSPGELTAYAARLDIDGGNAGSESIVEKPEFGLWLLGADNSRVLVDAGAIGPDYLPGHAHCDTLSFEMSVDGARFIVNSGVYTYQGLERTHFRSTAAHNTVRIDGEEQHEIWAAFRVARRGYPIDVRAGAARGTLEFTAGHTGYRRLAGRPTHHRRIRYESGVWAFEDSVTGDGTHRVESFIHLHPGVEVLQRDARRLVTRVGGTEMTIAADEGSRFEVDEGVYSPEFGIRQAATRLAIDVTGPLPVTTGYRIFRRQG